MTRICEEHSSRPNHRVMNLRIGVKLCPVADTTQRRYTAMHRRQGRPSTNCRSTRYHPSTVCGKKVPPKVVCRFLSNHSEFLREILHKRHLITFNYCKVTEFLCDYLVIFAHSKISVWKRLH